MRLFLRFFAIFCLLSIITGAAYISDEEKSISRLIIEDYASALAIEGVEGGIYFKWKPRGEVIVYDENSVEVYNSNKLDAEYLKESFLDGSSSFRLKSIDIVNDTANAEVEIFHGTSLSYLNHLKLLKSGERWKIVSKIFYELK